MHSGKLLSRLTAGLCCVASPVIAQLPLPAAPVYAHYTSVNSSLPAELIYEVHADHNGYLWLATDQGLVRYNGHEFTLVDTGTPEDFVATCVTSDKHLWLFAYSGHTACLDLNTQKIINTDSLYGLPPSGKPFLQGFQNGSVLTLYRQGINKSVRVRLDTRQSRSLTWNIPEAAQDLLRQYRFSQSWQQQLLPELWSILLHNCHGLSIKDSFIVIGNRIFQVAPGREATLYFNGADYGIRTSLMGFARREDDLYLGGLRELGLCRIRGYFSRPRSRQRVEYLLPGTPVTSVEKDYLGNIWAGTHGNGLFLFPYSENATLHYNKSNSGLHSDRVSYIGRFPGSTALGYDNAAIDFYTPGKPPQRYTLPARSEIREVRHMERMPSGWRAFTRTEAFFAGLQPSGLPGSFRTAILEEPSIDPGYKDGRPVGNVLYYISSNVLAAMDATGSISRCRAAGGILPKKTCLLPLSDTAFYIGTVRGCYRNAGKLPYLQEEQVNAVDTICGMLLWATNTGLYALAQQDTGCGHQLRKIMPGPCHSLKHDSLFTYLRCGDELVIVRNSTWTPVAHFSCRDYILPFRLNDFQADGDYLALAGDQGVFYISLRDLLHRPAAPAPRMHVLCSLSGRVPADSGYRCRFRNDLAIQLRLDILDYQKAPREVSCRVFRNGKELYRQAVPEGDKTVTLHPATPGRYRVEFHVRAAAYSEKEYVTAYTLIIAPLWYQQWWSLPALVLLLGVAGSGALYGLYVRRMKEERRRLQQRLYLQDLEAQSLLGQLKPHFIFNILTPLQGFFMSGEKVRGLDYLDSFARLMRGMLNSIRGRYAPLGTETDLIRHYLQIQQERFNHCFSYNITIDPSLDVVRCTIPTLLLQPLVENAVEHGIVKTGKGGRIAITVEDNGAAIAIRIKDNGKGLPPDFRMQQDHALTIIAERIQLLKKMTGTGNFSIGNNNDGEAGVTAVLVLPKNNPM